jgi:hypothetical protein
MGLLFMDPHHSYSKLHSKGLGAIHSMLAFRKVQPLTGLLLQFIGLPNVDRLNGVGSQSLPIKRVTVALPQAICLKQCD